jgi:hypothetical protein
MRMVSLVCWGELGPCVISSVPLNEIRSCDAILEFAMKHFRYAKSIHIGSVQRSTNILCVRFDVHQVSIVTRDILLLVIEDVSTFATGVHSH